MNILFLNKFNDYWKDKSLKLKEEFPQIEFTATYNPDERLDALKKADAVVSGRLTEDEIQQAERLKVIFVPFTGLNTFPLELIKRKNIIISNTHVNAKYVAERAVALALSLLGRVVEFHNDLKQGKWNRSIEGEDMWTSIQNKTCAIVGLGNIGLEIAKFLKGFNCRVIGVKKNPVDKLPENVDQITYNIESAIMKSEIIFLSLPSTDKTKGLINKELLMSMNGKYIINVGRGETVDEESLYESLKNGILKGAALDVWYNYPGKKTEPVFPANKPFWELPNVVLSPHKSSHTADAINAMIDDTVENIRSYIISGTPKSVADF
jgi:lactate dehydrogenase-like 2-hydroxyacid dehydrogenase